MKEIDVRVNESKHGFKLFFLEFQEWEQVPQFFPKDPGIFQAEWLMKMRPFEKHNKIRPGVLRLRPGLHYVYFKDQDRQGSGYPVHFFLSEQVMVIVGYSRLNQEKVQEWANRGIINTPMDLARILGTRILRHHQTRLESIEDQMDRLEEEILKNPVARQQSKIIALHRKVIGLKKSLNHHLTAFDQLGTIDRANPSLWPELITETERELENIRQTHDLVESLREAYQAAVDNRANDIMKLLTILATVLLPINLLTSFFGMNFENMPLLSSTYGIRVFYALSLLILVTVVMYLWKKDWLR